MAMSAVRVDSLSRAGSVTPAHQFETRALEGYCRANLPGFVGPLSIRQFHGGVSNPTFLLTDAGSGSRYVMRKKPPGMLLPSAHAIEREYRIMRALGATDVVVPHMLCLCEDSSIIGASFYLMPFLTGRIYKTNRLEDMSSIERRAAYKDAAKVLARIHAADYETLGLGDFGRPGNYFSRQIARWTKQYRGAQTDEIPTMDWLIDHLGARIPPDDRAGIVHGDYRLENLMFHPTEPRIIAVLDWELSTLGHPLADLAFFCLFYHADFMPWGGPHDRDFLTTGVPAEADHVADYCQASGREGIADWSFFLAFSAFRVAAIAQGVYRRGRDGSGMIPTTGPANGAKDWADLAQRLARS